jgi:hypothetical protein
MTIDHTREEMKKRITIDDVCKVPRGTFRKNLLRDGAMQNLHNAAARLRIYAIHFSRRKLEDGADPGLQRAALRYANAVAEPDLICKPKP